MPGFTAWFGVNEIGKPKAGETFVVSAASGAVGSVPASSPGSPDAASWASRAARPSAIT